MAVMKIGGPRASVVEIVGDDGAITRTTRERGEPLDLPAYKTVHADALAGRATSRTVEVVNRGERR